MSLRQSPLKSWVPVRVVNTHAAPTERFREAMKSSLGPPMIAVLQVSATEKPCWPKPTAPLPTNLLPCWVQTLLLRVNTHAAPAPLPSPRMGRDQPVGPGLWHAPPTMAVLPEPDSATEKPCWGFPTAPVPSSLRSCVHPNPPLLMNTHAAPAPLLSFGPPTMAVLPGP